MPATHPTQEERQLPTVGTTLLTSYHAPQGSLKKQAASKNVRTTFFCREFYESRTGSTEVGRAVLGLKHGSWRSAQPR